MNWECFFGIHEGKWQEVTAVYQTSFFGMDLGQHEEVKNARKCVRCGITEVRDI